MRCYTQSLSLANQRDEIYGSDQAGTLSVSKLQSPDIIMCEQMDQPAARKDKSVTESPQFPLSKPSRLHVI